MLMNSQKAERFKMGSNYINIASENNDWVNEWMTKL